MRAILFLWVVQAYAAFNLTWGIPAVNLDSNPIAGDTDLNAAVAIDPFGNAVATWGRTAGNYASEDIWAALYNHSSRVWTGALKISGGGSSSNSQVAMDSLGNAIVVWDEGFPTQIKYRSLSSTGVWDPPLAAPPLTVKASINPQTFPQIAVDSSGNALVIWTEFFGKRSHICSAKKPFGSGWVDLGEISSGRKSATTNLPTPLALNEIGNGVAVWQESNGQFLEVHGARYMGGHWSSPIAISTVDGESAQNPAVAMDSADNALFVWSQSGIIQSKSLLQGALSATPLAISDPAYHAQHPDIAIDGQGNAVVVFERSDGMNKFISSAILNKNEEAWSHPRDISGPSSIAAAGAGYPMLSLNAIGDGVAIWKEYDGAHIIIQGAGYSLGTWSFIRTLSSLRDNAGAPIPSYDIGVSVNLAGNIIAVWPEDPSGNGAQQIKATSGVGLANVGPLPPLVDPITILDGIASGYQVLHRFPAHSDLINILTWATAPGGDIAHYNIYRGSFSLLIGMTSDTRYEDHQRIPGEKVPYFITAVDRNGQESSPLTVFVHPK